MVYEFDGCFWFGCPTCFPVRHEPHPRLLGRTRDDVFRLRNEKHDALRRQGYTVQAIWECQWTRRKQTDPVVQTFLQTFVTPQALETPFLAGEPMRTNCITKPERGKKFITTITRVYTPTSINIVSTLLDIPRSSISPALKTSWPVGILVW